MNNFLAISYAFMLAFCPSFQTGQNNKEEVFKDSTHVQFQLGLEICDKINLYAGEETYQYAYKGLFNWYPYTQSYWLGAEYKRTFSNALTCKAGITHRCQHPLDCWDKQESTFNSASTDVYFVVEGKLKVF